MTTVFWLLCKSEHHCYFFFFLPRIIKKNPNSNTFFLQPMSVCCSTSVLPSKYLWCDLQI